MAKKTNELTEEQLAILNEGFPVASENSNSLILPRLGMLSKDITEESGSGKLKKIKVVEAAGTFFIERDLGDVDEETGKKKWTREYIEGGEIEAVITYHRRQLRMYDSSLEKFYSTPIFDSADQIVPLYLDKQVVKKGTQADLQAMFPAVTLKGKPSSKLKEETILFVLYKDELFQCNISQSSKWEFKSYARKSNPASCVTLISSKEDTFGDNTFSKMTFTEKRKINGEEYDLIVDSQNVLKEKVESDKKFYLPEATSQADKDFDAIEAEASKKLN